MRFNADECNLCDIKKTGGIAPPVSSLFDQPTIVKIAFERVTEP